CFFFCLCYVLYRDLHSFPTRRSSDLLCTMFGLLYYLVTELIYIMNLLPNAYQKINQFFIQYVQTAFLPNYEHLQSFLPFLPTLRSEEHTSELQSRFDIVCRLLLEKKN